MAFVLAMVVISHIQHYAADIYDDGRRDGGIVGHMSMSMVPVKSVLSFLR